MKQQYTIKITRDRKVIQQERCKMTAAEAKDRANEVQELHNRTNTGGSVSLYDAAGNSVSF